MATIVHDEQSDQYHIRFRFAGRAFRRSLKTDQKSEATASLARLTETISLVRRGVLDLPAEADPVSFLLSGGRMRSVALAVPSITLGQLFTKYQNELPEQAKEASTLKTETTHIKIFRKKNNLPLSKPLCAITTHDIQQFINSESRRKASGRRLSPDTVKREIDTLKCILNWAESQQLVSQAPSLHGLIYGKRDEKPPFMTRTEIERIIARGGLKELEVAELWECLYLTIPEVHEVLEFVRENARYPFLYPMFAFVAFTGARRSEMARVLVDDIDLAAGTVLIRERKRSRVRSTTFRRVEIPTKLVEILKGWLSQHPGGQFAFGHNFEKPFRPPTMPLTVDQARVQFSKALRDSKWDVIRGFHVFRHSYASNLASKGVDQRIIDKHMGHQTEEMRKRYQHLAPQVCQRAVEALSG